MSRKRLGMKPITDLWWCYCRTNRENLCTFFWYCKLAFLRYKFKNFVAMFSHSASAGVGIHSDSIIAKHTSPTISWTVEWPRR
jgi:hypothetical protein